MTPDIPFVPFNKIPRFNRTVVVTEKIDGTNASVYIPEDNPEGKIFAGSRNRWITPDNDNYGFASWVQSNKEELLETLGPGHHFGEWFGKGIQRNYGLQDRRFLLFNTSRWRFLNDLNKCVGCVPVLGIFQSPMLDFVSESLGILRTQGSLAVPGFMNPEGVVVYHSASNQVYKILLENDDIPKSLINEAANV